MTARETIRVFIALDISEAARSALSGTVDHLRTAIPRGARWVDPQGIHLTLKFLGNINPVLTDGILESLCRIGEESSKFSLSLAGLGVFPNQREPRVLWAGLEGEMEPLAVLHEKVEAAMADQGFERAPKSLTPGIERDRRRDVLKRPLECLGIELAGALVQQARDHVGEPFLAGRIKRGGASEGEAH